MRYQYRYYFHNAQQAYDWSETMEYIIEMCNITKEFPGIIANDDITLQLKKGEIHALLGENGAGKSTLKFEAHTAFLISLFLNSFCSKQRTAACILFSTLWIQIHRVHCNSH